jgi:hypothetical protein
MQQCQIADAFIVFILKKVDSIMVSDSAVPYNSNFEILQLLRTQLQNMEEDDYRAEFDDMDEDALSKVVMLPCGGRVVEKFNELIKSDSSDRFTRFTMYLATPCPTFITDVIQSCFVDQDTLQAIEIVYLGPDDFDTIIVGVHRYSEDQYTVKIIGRDNNNFNIPVAQYVKLYEALHDVTPVNKIFGYGKHNESAFITLHKRRSEVRPDIPADYSKDALFEMLAGFPRISNLIVFNLTRAQIPEMYETIQLLLDAPLTKPTQKWRVGFRYTECAPLTRWKPFCQWTYWKQDIVYDEITSRRWHALHESIRSNLERRKANALFTPGRRILPSGIQNLILDYVGEPVSDAKIWSIFPETPYALREGFKFSGDVRDEDLLKSRHLREARLKRFGLKRTADLFEKQAAAATRKKLSAAPVEKDDNKHESAAKRETLDDDYESTGGRRLRHTPRSSRATKKSRSKSRRKKSKSKVRKSKLRWARD